MKKLLFLAVLLLALRESAYSQKTNCAQVLRLAQSTYEQGRLHELPELMRGCFELPEASGGFTKQQRVEAYRYLTLAYVYLEEPGKADSSMLKLLQTDHYYQPNPLVDPAEFLGLYKTFRTTPVFSFGAKLGVNYTLPFLSNNYYVANASKGSGKWSGAVAFQFGLVFERNFFERSRNKFLKKVTFAPEVLYTTRSVAYSNPKVFVGDQSGGTVASFTISPSKVSWLDINPIFQYRLNDNTLNPYVGFGPGFSMRMNGSNQMTLTRVNSVGTVTGTAVVSTINYNKLVYSLIAVGGIKYQFGSIKLTVEGRVQYGLTNIVKADSRSTIQQVFDYAYLPSDSRQMSAMINIGFVYPYFNPIKLVRKR